MFVGVRMLLRGRRTSAIRLICTVALMGTRATVGLVTGRRILARAPSRLLA